MRRIPNVEDRIPKRTAGVLNTSVLRIKFSLRFCFKPHLSKVHFKKTCQALPENSPPPQNFEKSGHMTKRHSRNSILLIVWLEIDRETLSFREKDRYVLDA
jgi:hypothetical protein